MAEGSGNSKMEHQSNIIGPDLFGFYKHEIVDLLNHDESLPKVLVNRNNTPYSSSHATSSFSKSLEDAVPVFKRDLLKASLRQSVRALTQEVDEMIDPVMRIRHIIACLNSKTNKHLDGEALVTRDLHLTSPPCIKQKMRSSNGKEDLLTEQNRDAETGTAEDNEDLKLLLGSKISMVEEIMTKQSNEHYAMLNHMELQLEELLGAVASKCRRMTRQEKHELQKLIQELPPRNLDRIVEIIHHGKSFDALSLDEIVVNLEEQENATLWRLYFYTRAVESARKLAA